MPKAKRKPMKSRARSTPRQTNNRPSKAIITVPAAPSRPWELGREEIELVKNQICKGATDGELQLCLTVARRFKLDPLRGQIWFIPYKDREAPTGKRWVPVVGINGLLHIAARDHRDFGAIEEPEFGPEIDIHWTFYERKGTLKAPVWSKVKCWKKGLEHPVVATVRFTEIYSDAAIANSDKVRQMPYGMIGKCATAAVVRRAWPATDGLYIREEFQNPPEFTDSGRQIVYPDAEPLQPAPLIENAPHGHEPGSEKAKQAEAQLAKVEAEDRRIKEERANKFPGSNPGREATHVASGSTEAEGLKPSVAKFHLEIDHNSENGPIIRGDAGDILPLLEKFIKATWGADEFWHVRVQDVDTIHAASKELKTFTVTEIFPKQVPSPEGKSGTLQPKAGTTAGPAQGKSVPTRKETGRASATANPMTTVDAGPQLVAGIIEQANPQSGKSPRLDVLLRMETSKVGVWMSTFDTKLFPYLTAGKGQQSELIVKKNVKGDKTYTNIVGLKRIGVKEFDEDGKAILSVHREPGTPTLFQP